MQTMTPEQLGTDKVRWDLSFLYKGIDDPQIDKDLEALVAAFKKFNQDYKGNLGEKLGSAISDYIKNGYISEKLFVYLYFLQSLNVADPVVKAKVADVERTISQASGEYMTFYNLEIIALDNA